MDNGEGLGISKYKAGADRHGVARWEFGFAFEQLMNLGKIDTQ